MLNERTNKGWRPRALLGTAGMAALVLAAATGCGSVATDPVVEAINGPPKAAASANGNPEQVGVVSPIATGTPKLPQDPDKSPTDDTPNNTGPK